MVTAFTEGLASQDVIATDEALPGHRPRGAQHRPLRGDGARVGGRRWTATWHRSRRRSRPAIPMIMLSNATYPALDPDNGAGWSPAIATGLLRDQLGFTGVVDHGLPQRDGAGRARSPPGRLARQGGAAPGPT